MLLAAAGVVALLFAMRLTAAAFGCDFSPFPYLGISTDHGTRAVLLALALAGLIVLVSLVLRHGEEMLWLPVEGGGVLMPAAALARLVEQTAGKHPEVVRADAALRVRDGAVTGTVRVYGRPLTDPTRFAAEVEPAVRGSLARVVGAASGPVVVRPRVLTVPQLKRYLP